MVHNFGRADEVDRDGLRRLIKSINRVLDASDAVADGSSALPEIEIEQVFELRAGRGAGSTAAVGKSRHVTLC